jgi:hypothetical protein
MICAANPGGVDGHVHGTIALDTLTGNGQTSPGGRDGHSHVIRNWTALAGDTGHTHSVSCEYDPSVNGGGGDGSGY